MKKAFSAVAIAVAIMAGVVFAGYQWTKYQYGGETYYALVGEARNRVVVGRSGGRSADSAVVPAVGRAAHVRDLVVYDGEGRRKVCRLPLNARVNKVLRRGGYVSVVKCRRGLIWKCIDKGAVPHRALERIAA